MKKTRKKKNRKKKTIELQTQREQHNLLVPWKNWKGESEISLLANSIYYFLQCVFILKGEKEYRLLVIHNNRVLTDLLYNTLRGARIGFTKLYGDKAWEEDVRADWTHFYPPDETWLADKLKGISLR